LYTNSRELYNIRHFDIFAAGSVHLKKPSGGPKGLIGSPCQGVEGFDTRCVNNFPQVYNILYFGAFPVASIHLKKPSVARRAYRLPSPRGGVATFFRMNYNEHNEIN
jgi:hypothetical protein